MAATLLGANMPLFFEKYGLLSVVQKLISFYNIEETSSPNVSGKVTSGSGLAQVFVYTTVVMATDDTPCNAVLS